MSTKFSSGRTRRVYEFIRTHRHRYDVREMCRVLEVRTPTYRLQGSCHPDQRARHAGDTGHSKYSR